MTINQSSEILIFPHGNNIKLTVSERLKDSFDSDALNTLCWVAELCLREHLWVSFNFTHWSLSEANFLSREIIITKGTSQIQIMISPSIIHSYSNVIASLFMGEEDRIAFQNTLECGNDSEFPQVTANSWGEQISTIDVTQKRALRVLEWWAKWVILRKLQHYIPNIRIENWDAAHAIPRVLWYIARTNHQILFVSIFDPISGEYLPWIEPKQIEYALQKSWENLRLVTVGKDGDVVAEYFDKTSQKNKIINTSKAIPRQILVCKSSHTISFHWFSIKAAKEALEQMEVTLREEQIHRIHNISQQWHEIRITHVSKTWDMLVSDISDILNI